MGSAGADREQAVFAALADPTRRAVLRTIASGEAVTATELAARLPVSRQAVQKHLAQLEDARLVDGERVGRETRFAATPAPLGGRDRVDDGRRLAVGRAARCAGRGRGQATAPPVALSGSVCRIGVPRRG